MANYAVMNPGKGHLGHWYNAPPYHQRIYNDELEPYKNIQFKTSVLHNRRIYLGNVKVEYQDGKKETLSDTILKSEPAQFDKFTKRGRIDVAVGDGEDIIKLESYADRILEFKNRTLHVINASAKGEFLEDSFKYKGVSNPQAVARTDYGVAWANEFGCYMYDGRQIHDLLEENVNRKIKQSTWSSFVTDNSMVGYNPTKRQILVIDSFKSSESSGHLYLYDIPTRSWIKGLSRVDAGNKSNFAVNPTANGASTQLVYGKNSTNNAIIIEPWSDSSQSGTISLILKDEDFGEPHIRKKIHKVYVTAKNGDNITLSAAVNGSENFSDITFNSASLTTSNSWYKTEHKVTNGGNNVESIQIKLSGSAESDFEVNDISIIYRAKGIK